MRYLNKNLSLDFDEKTNPENLENNSLVPWYDFNNNIYENYKVIIGHWSTLGYRNKGNFISIDTGCSWGNKLTSIKILKNKKVKKIEIKC